MLAEQWAALLCMVARLLGLDEENLDMKRKVCRHSVQQAQGSKAAAKTNPILVEGVQEDSKHMVAAADLRGSTYFLRDPGLHSAPFARAAAGGQVLWLAGAWALIAQLVHSANPAPVCFVQLLAVLDSAFADLLPVLVERLSPLLSLQVLLQGPACQAGEAGFVPCVSAIALAPLARKAPEPLLLLSCWGVRAPTPCYRLLRPTCGASCAHGPSELWHPLPPFVLVAATSAVQALLAAAEVAKASLLFRPSPQLSSDDAQSSPLSSPFPTALLHTLLPHLLAPMVLELAAATGTLAADLLAPQQLQIAASCPPQWQRPKELQQPLCHQAAPASPQAARAKDKNDTCTFLEKPYTYIYLSLYLSLHIQTTVKPIALNLTNIYPKDRYSFKKRKFSLENDSFKNREFPLKPIGGKTEKFPYRNR